MKVELLYFEGCPNWQTAETRLRELAGEFRLELTRTDVGDGGEASDARFRGSPTILIDGRDPFPSATATKARTCRIYQTAEGPAGSPTSDDLRAALRSV